MIICQVFLLCEVCIKVSQYLFPLLPTYLNSTYFELLNDIYSGNLCYSNVGDDRGVACDIMLFE